jgi:flavin-dependent thymidylate synthase
MKVDLAGFNIDSTLIREASSLFDIRADAFTPETLSASYARISRSKLDIGELRRKALTEVEQARKANERIVFQMGHSSVAEHAVFNFDISNISRLAVEYLQSFRLTSFTEKSQRYVLFDEEFAVPEEIKNIGLADDFGLLMKRTAALYHQLYKKLISTGLEEEQSKEDARYATGLASLTQMGMTVNARILEEIIVRLRNAPLKEVRDLSKALLDSVKGLVPSLVKYTDEDPYYREWYDQGSGDEKESADDQDVELINFDSDGEERVLAALMFQLSGKPVKALLNDLSRVSEKERLQLLEPIFRHMKPFHPLPRVFELAALTFQIKLSATAFAQLKRHRMLTLLTSPYQPALGHTIPPNILEEGLEEILAEAVDQAENFYNRIRPHDLNAADYALTNANRRRVLVKLDVRELYHISRIREDHHAQWDIRCIAGKMTAAAAKHYPLLMLMVGGKDRFPEIFRRVVG